MKKQGDRFNSGPSYLNGNQILEAGICLYEQLDLTDTSNSVKLPTGGGIKQSKCGDAIQVGLNKGSKGAIKREKRRFLTYGE